MIPDETWEESLQLHFVCFQIFPHLGKFSAKLVVFYLLAWKWYQMKHEKKVCSFTSATPCWPVSDLWNVPTNFDANWPLVFTFLGLLSLWTTQCSNHCLTHTVFVCEVNIWNSICVSAVTLAVPSHLSAAHADDAVDAAAGIIEEGHGDGVFAGWQPVAFGGRVDLEDMSSGAEDGLLPFKVQDNKREHINLMSLGIYKTILCIFRQHYVEIGILCNLGDPTVSVCNTTVVKTNLKCGTVC